MNDSNSPIDIAQRVRRHFAAELASRGYQADAEQTHVLAQLADWLQARLGGRRALLRRPPAGIYLWGGVGRGKSFVMDCLFEAAPVRNKRRVHFHAFLQELQQRLLRHGGQPEPMARVAAELAGEATLLCFDEFHVHDIGDGILLGRLIQHLLRENVALVLTSNYAPDQLCPNPLYHERFKPFIDLLRQRLRVLELNGGVDYRNHSQRDWGVYCWPDSPRSEAWLRHRLGPLEAGSVRLERLTLPVTGRGERRVWLRFADLFEVPSATRDYLLLCQGFDCVAISGIPSLQERSLDIQQRFLNFVDIAYDAGVELLLSSEMDLAGLCRGVAQQDFARAHSRLAQLRRQSLAPLERFIPGA